MTPNECECNCKPTKCCPDECCKGLGDECQCKNKEEIKVEFEPDMNLTIHQMVTQKEFIELYKKKSPEEFIKMKTCSVDGCKETNCSFIDSRDMLDVKFYCTEHWRDRDRLRDMESRQSVARHTQTL